MLTSHLNIEGRLLIDWIVYGTDQRNVKRRQMWFRRVSRSQERHKLFSIPIRHQGKFFRDAGWIIYRGWGTADCSGIERRRRIIQRINLIHPPSSLVN